MNGTHNRRSLLSFAALALMALPAFAGSLVEPVNKNRSGVALNGYDAVAYFTKGQPVKGNQQFAYSWQGAIWWFENKENKDHFVSNPYKYAPQFGGYCSWAVGHGYTADVDPEAWKIIDNRLYLNYSKGIQKRWEKEMQPLIDSANKNWPGLHR